MAVDLRYTCLHLAVVNNELIRVQQLLEQEEIDCDARTSRDETPLFLSIKNNCKDEMVLMLINNGCNVNIPDKRGVTPLHLAVQRENTTIIFKLLEKGADIHAKDNQYGYTPIQRVLMRGRLQILRNILQLFEKNSQQKIYEDITLLLFSLKKKCNDKIVSFLIDYGEDVNARDAIDVTPLHIAIKQERTNIARKLLKCGAKINARNSVGSTPLHQAIYRKRDINNICMLLYYNVSVNEKNSNGLTPFEVALFENHYSTAMLLIDYVADFNCVDEYTGYTSLHYAIQKCPDISIDIIKRGGDVNILWHETHILSMCIWCHESSEVFETVWPRIDYKVFLQVVDVNNFIETFVSLCKFPDNQFVKCLYMILNSPHLSEFFNYFPHFHETWYIFTMIIGRDMPQIHRLNIIWILLSYGVEVSFNSICYIYGKRGFDECIESILLSGCHICDTDISINPIVCKILYDNFKIYEDISQNDIFYKAHHLKDYSKFYRINLKWNNNLPLSPKEFQLYCVGGVKSLVQICRDIIRKIIYKTQKSDSSFKVYSALRCLSVPSGVRDILYLKKTIY